MVLNSFWVVADRVRGVNNVRRIQRIPIAFRDGIVLGAVGLLAGAAAWAFGVSDHVLVAFEAVPLSALGPIAAMWILLPVGIAWLAWRRLAEARRAIAQRDHFMESVAHRLRTPLSSVVGYSLLMRDEPHEARAEDLRWMVEEVATRSVEAADLLDDMLVAAHLEHGGIELLPAPVDLSDEVEWVLRNYLGSEEVSVRYTGFRKWVTADSVRVRQVLRILLGNARSHGGDKIGVDVDTTGGAVRVTVADNGAGLPLGREDAMFHTFATDAEPDDARFPIGLGLAVASQLASRMGGVVRYRRQEGWSCFDFFLPLADVSAITVDPPVYLTVADQEPVAATG